MRLRSSLPTLSLVAGSLLAVAAITSSIEAGRAPGGNPFVHLQLLELQSNFHEAGAAGDVDLLRSLWAEDAIFRTPQFEISGREAIVEFLSSNPLFGHHAALTASYKEDTILHGNSAEFAFECILVDVGDLDPMTTPLSSIPFGEQNPAVEIVQHSTARCTAVRQADRWVIQLFEGGAGPR